MTGRHVVVAGGSRGIGAACAQRFAAGGDRVSVISRNAGFRADLADPEAAARAIAQAEAQNGPVDVLVCTAGAARQAPLAELDAAALRAGMEAKYFTYVHAIMPVLEGMKTRGRGTIVTVIGTGGKKASATHLPGGAANAALMLLTTGLGHAYGGAGIRVLGVSPGPVATERFEQLVAARAANDGVTLEEARRRLSSDFPSGEITRPEEVAEVVAFLAGPGASGMNGTIVTVDGGSSPVL